MRLQKCGVFFAYFERLRRVAQDIHREEKEPCNQVEQRQTWWSNRIKFMIAYLMGGGAILRGGERWQRKRWKRNSEGEDGAWDYRSGTWVTGGWLVGIIGLHHVMADSHEVKHKENDCKQEGHKDNEHQSYNTQRNACSSKSRYEVLCNE